MHKQIKMMTVVLSAVILAGCQSSTDNKSVVTTMFAHFDITRELTKETDIQVDFPVAPGVDLHDWEPTVSAISTVMHADLLITVGLEFDAWVEGVLSTGDFKGIHMDASTHVELITGHAHEEEVGEDHEEDEVDPHYWLDPQNALSMADAIKDALIESFSEDETQILENFEVLSSDLNLLIDGYTELLGDNHHESDPLPEEEHEHSTLIYAGHNAFGYLVHYGVEFITPYTGFSMSSLPTPSAIAELIDTVEALGSTYIYASQLEGTAVAEAILTNIPGLEIVTLSTIENVITLDRNEVSYISLMQSNLDGLKLSIDHD
jgi:zinc transport system substrate-binding protein